MTDWRMSSFDLMKLCLLYIHQKLFIGRTGSRNYVHIPRALFHK